MEIVMEWFAKSRELEHVPSKRTRRRINCLMVDVGIVRFLKDANLPEVFGRLNHLELERGGQM